MISSSEFFVTRTQFVEEWMNPLHSHLIYNPSIASIWHPDTTHVSHWLPACLVWHNYDPFPCLAYLGRSSWAEEHFIPFPRSSLRGISLKLCEWLLFGNMRPLVLFFTFDSITTRAVKLIIMEKSPAKLRMARVVRRYYEYKILLLLRKMGASFITGWWRLFSFSLVERAAPSTVYVGVGDHKCEYEMLALHESR